VVVVAGVGAGFLLAVLWFDLMFDMQVRGSAGEQVPVEVRDSIAAYYRRVTTTARPMNRLVAAAMVTTLGALIAELASGDVPASVAIASLALTIAAVALAATRTVPAAVRLGAQTDPPERQSSLARTIYRDHLCCITAIAATVLLQVFFT
jgi:hypothetical protein